MQKKRMPFSAREIGWKASVRHTHMRETVGRESQDCQEVAPGGGPAATSGNPPTWRARARKDRDPGGVAGQVPRCGAHGVLMRLLCDAVSKDFPRHVLDDVEHGRVLFQAG